MPARPRRVLIITQYGDLTRRILQEAHSLADAGYDVRILARAETNDSTGEVEGIPVEWVAVQGRDPRFGWLYRLAGVTRGSQAVALWGVLTGRRTFELRALSRAIVARADAYHAQDLINLDLAHRAAQANHAKLIYASHELFPDITNRWIRLKRRAWMRLERRLMPLCDLTLTVNELIAQVLAERNHVPPPLVVLNCPDPPPDFDPNAHYDLIRQRLNLPAARKIALYQGYLYEGRGVEGLVRAAPLLADNAAVVVMGYGPYETVLREIIESEGLQDRAYLLPAVPYQELLPYCASADIGVIPIQNLGLNYYYTSPNKLFDFIQAAVPIVANDLPYLRKVVAGEKLGVVAKLETPQQYAEAINQVLTSPDAASTYRANLRRVAPNYTWSTQARKLVAAYNALWEEGLGAGG